MLSLKNKTSLHKSYLEILKEEEDSKPKRAMRKGLNEKF